MKGGDEAGRDQEIYGSRESFVYFVISVRLSPPFGFQPRSACSARLVCSNGRRQLPCDNGFYSTPLYCTVPSA